MNPPKCKEEDYIDFLIATQKAYYPRGSIYCPRAKVQKSRRMVENEIF
jgi:hypothetical protein